jgi:filamentous hemagglutinin family protein
MDLLKTKAKRVGQTIFLVGAATICLGEGAICQIVPDGTLGSQVNGGCDGAGVCNITDGSVRGGNLFHSFQQFSLPNRSAAQFTTLPTTENVIVRVTGLGQPFISNINGVISTSNPTNFFLINPNGIQFGEYAGLSIGGSFLATTAELMQFRDGAVLRTDDPAPLLTVNVLTGLQFGKTPGNIQMQSSYFFAGRFDDFKNFTLVGGDILLDDTWVYAPGQRIELSSLGSRSTIEITSDGSLKPTNLIDRVDVSLARRSILSVMSSGNGNVNIYARNINLQSGSRILLGISENSTNLTNRQAGNLVLDATGDIRLDSGSFLQNDIDSERTGNSGDIKIIANSLFLSNNSSLSARVFGGGRAGNVNIFVKDKVNLNRSSIRSQIATEDSSGQSGDIQIFATNTEILNRSQISAATYGNGNAGNVFIDSTDSLIIEGATESVGNTLSGIFSLIEEDAIGNAGSINIQTGNLQIRNNVQISSLSKGVGNAGKIIIQAKEISIFGVDSFLSTPVIASFVASGGIGDGGDIEINVDSLKLYNGTQIAAGVTGVGIGGNIKIQAEEIIFAGKNPSSFGNGGSSIISSLSFSGYLIDDNGVKTPFGVGRAGNIEIQTRRLNLEDDAFIEVSSAGQGDAGNVKIRAQDILLNDSSDIRTSSTEFGNAGNIDIQTDSLRLNSGSQISAFTEGEGKSGNISIIANDRVELSGSNTKTGNPSALFTDNVIISSGKGGDINIETNYLQVSDAAIIDAQTRNQESGGDIKVVANIVDVIDGGQILSTSEGDGKAGSITVNARESILINGQDVNYMSRREQFGNRIGIVDASSGLFVRADSTGEAGDINLISPLIRLNNRGKVNAESLSGNGGSVNVNDNNILLLRQGAEISTTAGTSRTKGNGGDININSKFIVAVPKENSDIRANAFSGSGGNVLINTQGLFGITPLPRPNDNLSDITASSELGTQGSIAILQPDVRPEQGINELPTDLIDPSNQISKECPRGSTNRPMGSFTVTGKGGIPTNPIDSPSTSAPLPPLFNAESPPIATTQQSLIAQTTEPPIVEAQGWFRSANGRIHLIANQPQPPHSTNLNPNCIPTQAQ